MGSISWLIIFCAAAVGTLNRVQCDDRMKSFVSSRRFGVLDWLGQVSIGGIENY